MLFYGVTCFYINCRTNLKNEAIYWVTLVCNIVTSKEVLNSIIIYTLHCMHK